MPNTVKYSTGSESQALRSGNFYLGVGDVSKGPTSSTGFWNGISPPVSGYTIYLDKVSQGPSIYVPDNDSVLISLTNTLANSTFTSTTQCFNWYVTQNDKMVVNKDYPTIVTSGLVLNLDASFRPSYTGSGTTWYDISLSAKTTSLVNGPTYSSNYQGQIVFDGTDDYVSIGNIVVSSASSTTIEVIISNNNPNFRTPTAAQLDKITGGTTTGTVDAYEQYTLSNTSTIPLIVMKNRCQYSSGVGKWGITGYYQILGNNLNNYPEFYRDFYNTDGSIFSQTTFVPSLLYGNYFHYTWVITNSGSGARTITHYLNGTVLSVIGGNHTEDFTFFNLPNLRLGNISQSIIPMLRIYERALTSTEVLSNFNASKWDFLPNIVQNNLIYYFDAGKNFSFIGSTVVNDLAGRRYNTTLVNGPLYSENDGGYVFFDGTNDYGSTPSFSLSNTNSQISFEFWIKVNAPLSSIQAILSDRAQSNTVGYIFLYYNSDGTITYQFARTTTRSQVSATIFNSGYTDTWVNIAITTDYVTNQVKFYRNSILLSTKSMTDSQFPSVSRVKYLGAYGTNGDFGKMYIGSMRIYTSVLSDDDVAQNYNATKSRFGL